MKHLIYHLVNDDELLRITNKIREYEKLTAGEICVSIREKKHFMQRRRTVDEMAKHEFMRLGIAKTRTNGNSNLYTACREAVPHSGRFRN